jgi:GT2 family glycosyltransferase
MTVTVVVASRNRRADLLASLPRHEAPVILVDNGSTDGTVDAVRPALPEVRVIGLPRNVGAVARTIGALAATTPYVAFADDDSWWAPGALARAAALLDAHPTVALVTGRMLVGPQERIDPMSLEMAAAPLGISPGGAGPDVLGFAACAAVVRRSAFLAVGGFDPVVRFPGEEERVALDLADAGWLMSYVDDLVVHHHPSPSRGSADGRRRQIVRSRLLTACMRRPWRDVLALAAADLRADAPSRSGVIAALTSLPGALARRRRISPQLEARLARLSAAPSPTTAGPVTSAASAEPVTPASAEPVTSAACAEPVKSAACAEPVTAAACAEPLASAASVEPVTSAACAEPVKSAACAEPVTAAACAEPVTSAASGSPVARGASVGLAASAEAAERAGSAAAVDPAASGLGVPEPQRAPEVSRSWPAAP